MGEDQGVTWGSRAELAGAAVRQRFGGRLAGIPLTHLARVAAPDDMPVKPFTVPISGVWHYWWQAHYLDALVDAANRRLHDGDRHGAVALARLGHRHLATMRLRNALRFTNHYFDDMGWLTLAVGRLAALDERLGRRLWRASLRPLERWLARQLSSGLRAEGGMYWNRDRSFVNAATTAPVALAAARAGHRPLARNLLEWLGRTLMNRDNGLVVDGLRIGQGDGELVTAAFTYNQGTTLGLLLELGESASAERLITAISEHLVTIDGDRRVLAAQGGGDGGLFGGILARYLAVAAAHPALADEARATAARLVRDSAEALWERRRTDAEVFSHDPALLAEQSQPPGAVVELSTQVAAWLTLEAAARLDDAEPKATN